MKKVKIIGIVVLIIFMFFLIVNKVNAYSVGDLGGTPLEDSGATNFGNQIITVLTISGASTSVVVLIVLGIKYMMGSVEEKAEYKRTMMPYLIGAVFIFSASAISSVVYNVVKDIGS